MPDKKLLTLLVFFLVVGVGLRIEGVGEMALYGDEYHNHLVGEQPLGELLTTFDGVGSHVVTPVLQRLSLDFFGPGVVSFRLAALVPGILTLLLTYPAVRLLLGGGSETTAVLATAFLAVNPMHVYYSRYGRAYALVVLLGLLLVIGLTLALRAGSSARARRLSWTGVLVTAALLPVTHLASAGFVAAVGLAALFLGRPRWVPATIFGGAALLAFVLFLPVLDDVRAYFAEMQDVRDAPSTWFGIVLLVGGGAIEGGLALLGAIVAPFLLARAGGRRAAALVTATILGPLAALLVLRPHGMEYAWARYLLNATPFLAIAVAQLLVQGLATLRVVRLAPWLGLLLAVASLTSGPLFPDEIPRTGEFDNTYLALRTLPAFDEPWPDASPFYRDLAGLEGDGAVIETPPLVTRSVLLYRNHALVHGRDVYTAWLGGIPRAMGTDEEFGPYADLDHVTPADAEWIVLHRNLPNEVRRYFDDHVYGTVWPTLENALDEGLMRRQRSTFIGTQAHAQPDRSRALAGYLRERFGPPYYEDSDLFVWRLSE